MPQQIQKQPRKALTSGRISGGEVQSGDIVLHPKAPLATTPRDTFATPMGLRFDAAPWNKARKEFDADVEAILTKIDVARRLLGCDTQRRRDERLERWKIAAEPTGAYPVLTSKS